MPYRCGDFFLFFFFFLRMFWVIKVLPPSTHYRIIAKAESSNKLNGGKFTALARKLIVKFCTCVLRERWWNLHRRSMLALLVFFFARYFVGVTLVNSWAWTPPKLSTKNENQTHTCWQPYECSPIISLFFAAMLISDHGQSSFTLHIDGWQTWLNWGPWADSRSLLHGLDLSGQMQFRICGIYLLFSPGGRIMCMI